MPATILRDFNDPGAGLSNTHRMTAQRMTPQGVDDPNQPDPTPAPGEPPQNEQDPIMRQQQPPLYGEPPQNDNPTAPPNVPTPAPSPSPTDTTTPSVPDVGSNPLSGLPDWLKNLTGNFSTQQLAALATAWNQYNNSGQYMDLATKYAGQMDPFGPYRQQSAENLMALEKDPNAYLARSPDYQAALEQGLGALGRADISKGDSGGTANADVIRFGSQLGAQYLDKTRQSLMAEAGVNIPPTAAASLIQAGIEGSIKAKNDALASLFKAMFPDNGTGNTPASQNPYDSLYKVLSNAGWKPADIDKALAAAGIKPGTGLPTGATTPTDRNTGQGGPTQTTDTGQPPATPGNALQQTPDGKGWFDPSTGKVYDMNGNDITYQYIDEGPGSSPPPYDDGGSFNPDN